MCPDHCSPIRMHKLLTTELCVHNISLMGILSEYMSTCSIVATTNESRAVQRIIHKG